MRWMPFAVAALLGGAAPAALRAQQPPRPPAQDTTRPGERTPGDTAARDSAGRDTTRAELVHWEEPDSIMASLLARPGYVSTRYRANRSTFRGHPRLLELGGEAAVTRAQATVVGDTIIYRDSTQVVTVMGDSVVLRDLSQNSGDLHARGLLVYDLRAHRGLGTNIATTATESAQTWFVTADTGVVQMDTTQTGHSVTYAEDGTITSCDLPFPHYHFSAGEIKHISKSWIVARPAVLYVQDIPVFWLPFVFQDLRSGRHSGLLPMRFGLTDVIRTSANYRRQIEDLGYYFAINDYMDAQFSLDWRSGAHATDGDPGWMRLNGEWEYRWLNRFLSGHVATSYSRYSDGSTNTALSWTHAQSFSQRSSLNANINYVSNTLAQRQQALNVAQALATIYSALNYRRKIGGADFSLGGTRRQFTGRSEVDQDFPNFNITTAPISPVSWLVWSPQLSVTNSERSHIDQNAASAAAFRFTVTPGGALDSTRIDASQRNTRVNFDTPVRIGGFTWRNTFTVNDQFNDFPQLITIPDVRDTSLTADRVFAQTYQTSIDWTTSLDLPSLSGGKWNITPSLQIVNADPASAFWVRSFLSGGEFVHQSKRLQYTISSSPTFFGLFPGFGPFSRIRHSITPRISYSYAPQGEVSDDFLQAVRKTRVGDLSTLTRNQVTLALNQVFEAKVRQPGDSTPGGGEKLKLLQLDFSPITWDFERARKTGGTGLTTPSFSLRAASDLIPGLDLRIGWSLFEGNPQSDSARFKPFRESISAGLAIGRGRNPFAMLARLFGGSGAAPSDTLAEAPYDSTLGLPRETAPQVAGTTRSRYPLGVNTSQGWQLRLDFSAIRRRPPAGVSAELFDPTAICQEVDPALRERCEEQQLALAQQDTSGLFEGTRIARIPPSATLRASTSFRLTPNWAVEWQTGYDFERRRFSDHIVTLQRDMHDWRAIFAFTQSPTGSFAFNFFISLIAEPDLKFQYNQRTYRPTQP
ncbi:MAG TPA: putative LPS assembly protein LptD [Gemmatimonadaceae bacterium]|nr:putative LPS assembly protein LptD [Gemmatimonadaceae bacterium]